MNSNNQDGTLDINKVENIFIVIYTIFLFCGLFTSGIVCYFFYGSGGYMMWRHIVWTFASFKKNQNN